MIKKIASLLSRTNEVVVIGSSPILLIVALSLAKRGKNVTVVSEQKSWGGAWQYSSYMGIPIDTSCHLLESYAITHKVLRKYKVNLRPSSRLTAPVRLLIDKDNGKLYLEKYHSRHRILKEAWSKLLVFGKSFVLLFVEPFHSVQRVHFNNCFSDLLLFLRYRLVQIFFLEPLHWPYEGWPSLMKELTCQLHLNNIKVIDDRVLHIDDQQESSSIYLAKGAPITADLVISGQSTLLNSLTPCSSVVNSDRVSVRTRTYNHLLVELGKLPVDLVLPFYIHLPNDDIIHRLTYSHTTDLSSFYLVQIRKNTFLTSQVSDRIRLIFTKTIEALYDDSTFAFDHDVRNLRIQIVDKFNPTAVHPVHALDVKPVLTGRHLIIRTYGDLARNIAYHSQLLV